MRTPGPWKAWPIQSVVVRIYQDEQDRRCTAFIAQCNSAAENNEDNTKFIVQACNNYDELIKLLMEHMVTDNTHVLHVTTAEGKCDCVYCRTHTLLCKLKEEKIPD